MQRKPTSPRGLAFVIHDMNSWGGQDRSTLEIARRLSQHWPVEVHAFSLEGKHRGKLDFHAVNPNIIRPMLLRSMLFHGATLVPLWLQAKLKGGSAPLVHATGACSLISDVVHVQFIHAAWHKAAQAMSPDYRVTEGMAKDAYQKLLYLYDSAMEKTLFTNKRRYIAISKSVANDLRKLFGLRTNVTVIYHGVDSTRFRPSHKNRKAVRRQCGVGDRDQMLLFVGSYERKGLGPAIETVSRFSPAHRSRVKLVAVGSGNTKLFSALAARLGVSANLVFAPHTKEIIPYYQAADIFVLPTFYEPFGLVILEAMACGLPCLVSACAGASELMTEGKSGMLIKDPGSAAEIAKKLERLLDN
ncbi:MAG: glycosyltransferase family 4 protein, partial [Deltaproteobacteria bacterium]|nr:glycosyltransferase family 4 protein [Deltaproteobacteria bacterium]